MLTRQTIIDTPSPDEVLAVFKDERGVLRNVTVTDTDLNDELIATSATLPNPVHGSLVAERDDITARLTAIDAELSNTPSMLPNPDRPGIEDKIFAAAEAQLQSEED